MSTSFCPGPAIPKNEHFSLFVLCSLRFGKRNFLAYRQGGRRHFFTLRSRFDGDRSRPNANGRGGQIDHPLSLSYIAVTAGNWTTLLAPPRFLRIFFMRFWSAYSLRYPTTTYCSSKVILLKISRIFCCFAFSSGVIIMYKLLLVISRRACYT